MTDTGFLVTLALALFAATVGAAIAVRLGQSAILGYVAAGLIIGPYTAGPIADAATVGALADVGLIFLLFAVGLELSVRDMLKVGRVVVVGGLAQIAITAALGFGAAVALGFTPIEGLFFGAFVAQSSSTVIAKVFGERGEIDSPHSRLALAWSVVQDMSTVVFVVVLTALGQGGDLGSDLAVALAKAAVFLAILIPIGLWVLPAAFERLALLRSREVFVLSVVAVALGTAYVSELFGLSLALGAFLAGLLIGESDISHQISGELGPLRDVFAGVFFVSIGMLINPAFVVASPLLVLVAIALIVPVKGVVAAIAARLLRTPPRTAILAGVALAQAGEFSFLLARLGAEQGSVGDAMFSLMLAGAAVSIVLTAPLIRFTPSALREIDRRRPAGDEAPLAVVPDRHGRQRRYAVICGYGRVGRQVGAALERRGFPFIVVETDPRICREARARNIPVIQGPADNERNLERIDFSRAQVVVVTLPDPAALRRVVHHVRRAYPRVPVIARARSAADRDMLVREGVGEIVVAETEVALEIARFTLGRFGVSGQETAAIVQGMRRRAG